MSKAREGWSWGTTDSGEWLTILGAHWKPAVLTDTPDAAEKPVALEQSWNADRTRLAYVREEWHPGVASGRAYRILHTAILCPGSEYGHSAVGGGMYVHDEDIDEVAQARRANGDRPIECERCDATYLVGKGWRA